jgi:hypothetical protein
MSRNPMMQIAAIGALMTLGPNGMLGEGRRRRAAAPDREPTAQELAKLDAAEAKRDRKRAKLHGTQAMRRSNPSAASLLRAAGLKRQSSALPSDLAGLCAVPTDGRT